MKNICVYIGSYLPAGVGVTQMSESSFNPLHFSFWATLTGILFYSMIGAAVGSIITETIKKKKAQWNGTGQIRSKQPS